MTRGALPQGFRHFRYCDQRIFSDPFQDFPRSFLYGSSADPRRPFVGPRIREFHPSRPQNDMIRDPSARPLHLGLVGTEPNEPASMRQTIGFGKVLSELFLTSQEIYHSHETCSGKDTSRPSKWMGSFRGLKLDELTNALGNRFLVNIFDENEGIAFMKVLTPWLVLGPREVWA
jgi:hypothetical protein